VKLFALLTVKLKTPFSVKDNFVITGCKNTTITAEGNFTHAVNFTIEDNFTRKANFTFNSEVAHYIRSE